jgi:predicted DNA binding CopG/RHH family protein
MTVNRARKSLAIPKGAKVVAWSAEEDEETSALVTRLEAEAERDIAPGTVSLRWGKGQIAVVKRAAAMIGIPYQTYLKQVVYRQALADIASAAAALKPDTQARPSSKRARSRE